MSPLINQDDRIISDNATKIKGKFHESDKGKKWKKLLKDLSSAQ